MCVCVCAENHPKVLPKGQSEPDCCQFHSVVFHWVVEASHKSQPDLLGEKKKGGRLISNLKLNNHEKSVERQKENNK